MRIGLFGGTFDPVHRGHLEVASAAARTFLLDRVYFIPAGRPPHKRTPPRVSAWHRYAMLVLATKDRDDFFVSTVELETDKTAYTVDTVTTLRRLFSPESDFYLIMGADSFEEITQWKGYERLLALTHLVVMTRPGHALRADHLPERFRPVIVEVGSEPPVASSFAHGRRIFFCHAVSTGISATAVRCAVEQGEAIEQLVVPDVARYIAKYRLYRGAMEPLEALG